MRLKALLIITLTIGLHISTKACQCGPTIYSIFCETVSNSTSVGVNNNIVLAKVTSFTNDSLFIHIDIIEGLYGTLSNS